MNKLKVLFLSSIFMLSIMSCAEKTTYEEVYRYAIDPYNGGFENMAIIENYLTEKGCITTKIFTADSEKELDKQAIALFDTNNAKINEAELSLKLKTGKVTFSYSLLKGSPTIVVKESKYTFGN